MSGADSSVLLLFDIDGTLLAGASREHALALREALREVHGLRPDFQAKGLSAAGRTDGEIARLLLIAAGVDARRIDERADDVRAATCAAYAHGCPADLSHTVVPGIPELLRRLAGDDRVRLSLVTGNFEPVARLKLTRAGLGRWFARGQGGFGSDSEDRAALPAIARRRAGAGGVSFPRGATIVIGDTPRDIACARADEVRCVAVTTGRYGADELGDADAVAGPGELGAVLEPLLAG
jgi:phosphoglycolate phosphatase